MAPEVFFKPYFQTAVQVNIVKFIPRCDKEPRKYNCTQVQQVIVQVACTMKINMEAAKDQNKRSQVWNRVQQG